jgi:hypothetical protein
MENDMSTQHSQFMHTDSTDLADMNRASTATLGAIVGSVGVAVGANVVPGLLRIWLRQIVKNRENGRLSGACLSFARCAGFALTLLVSTQVFAQCTPTWLSISATGGPEARIYSASTFDSALSRIVLLGGRTATNQRPQATWVFSNGVWSTLTGTGPSGREQAAMCYDTIRGTTIAFGGFSGSGWLGDTWELTGSQWVLRSTGGPSARAGAAMAFDESRGVAVLFGGYRDSAGYLSDTWEWNGATWTVRPGPGPSARERPSMAYDSARGVIVLFGGSQANTSSLADTWELSTAGWTMRATTGPAPRDSAAMAFDPVRQRTVVFGGFTWPNPPYFGDSWAWDGSSWTRLAGVQGPGLRGLLTGAFDVARGTFVIFGGTGPGGPLLGDTWELAFVPRVGIDPASSFVCPAGTVATSVSVSGTGPFTYQWRKGSNPIDTIANPSAATATLTLTNVGPDDVDSYDCVVTNACGSATSNPATLTICPGDYNCDNGIDGDDVIGFFTDWDSGLIAADFNGDGGVDGDDVIDFFQRWDSGC